MGPDGSIFKILVLPRCLKHPRNSNVIASKSKQDPTEVPHKRREEFPLSIFFVFFFCHIET